MKKRPNATPSGPAGHSRQAFQGGTYSLMLTAAVLALLIVLNLLVSALPTNLTQYDISASKLYSVTSNTKVVVNALEQDVTIYWIVQSGEEDAVIENLLGKYESLSDHITVVKKNPDVYPTFAEQYTDETVANNSLVVECGERSRFISYDDLYLSEPDMYTYSYNTSFDGEGAITSAIDYVVNAEQPQLYRLEGHGESELPSTFQDQLEKANMELHDLSLLTVDAIPEDAACLLIYAPTSDISGEERDMLADYVTGGGKLLVMAGPVDGASLDNLYSLLSEYGVTANEGIVIESDREHYAFQAPFALLPDLASSAITDSLIDERYSPSCPSLWASPWGRTPTAPQSPPCSPPRTPPTASWPATSWTPTTRRREIWTAPSPWRSPWRRAAARWCGSPPPPSWTTSITPFRRGPT